MLFNEDKIVPTFYIPGKHLSSEYKELFETINTILWHMFSEGKLQMTSASKLSSGPVDPKIFALHHPIEGTTYDNSLHFYLCTVATAIEERKMGGAKNPNVGVLRVKLNGTGASIIKIILIIVGLIV